MTTLKIGEQLLEFDEEGRDDRGVMTVSLDGEPHTLEIVSARPPEYTVLLDGGSTTYELARLLVGRPLQVVTDSLPVANLFMTRPESDLIIVGGNIQHSTRVMTTTIALETSKGNLALALGLGLILVTIALSVNAAALVVADAARRRYG